MNKISKIDLEPLGNCIEMRALDIAGNQIDFIDISPLKNCKALEELYLYSDHPTENTFTELDLTALFSCVDLEDIGVPTSIDLKAAARCKKRKKIPYALEELIDDDLIAWI